MADFNAIAAVSRTLRRLLVDRMATSGVTVTLAPPDVAVGGVAGARVNAYLFSVEEDAYRRNDAIPGQEHPAAFGRPPLSLALRYLLTSAGRVEDQLDSDLIAQSLLGDALLVLHDFGGRVEELRLATNRVGAVGDRLLDPVLHNEFERVKLAIVRADLEEVSKLWSAMPEANFRRSAMVEARLVQLESRLPRRVAAPVETRRLLFSVARPPVVEAAWRTPGPPPADGLRDMRVGVGEEITIEHRLPIAADRLYVRFGALEPIRVPLPSDGRIRIGVPDDEYPVDLDHPAARPIAAGDRLQPGALEVRLVARRDFEGVEGGLDRGTPVAEARDVASNTVLLQLVPAITGVAPGNAASGVVLRVTGARLWDGAGASAVIVGGVAVPVLRPRPGDPWAAPTSTAVEIPVAAIADALDPGPTLYPVAIEVNGARTRETGFTFRLDP